MLISRLLVARGHVVVRFVFGIVIVFVIVIGFEVDLNAARGHCLGRHLAAVVAIAPRVIRQHDERGKVGQLEGYRWRHVYRDAVVLRVHGQESSCDHVVLSCSGCYVVRRARGEVLCLCPRAALLLRATGPLLLCGCARGLIPRGLLYFGDPLRSERNSRRRHTIRGTDLQKATASV
jgi:hypothetical protein